ncbi:hypothetical protein B566_EDAN001744 [Ephemera danica]|nr:hypothetical protein B566_EDAN001744 [Ephemera danica]
MNETLAKCFNAGQKIEAWCIMPPDTFRSTPIFTMDTTVLDIISNVGTRTDLNMVLDGVVNNISKSYVTLTLCVAGDNQTAHINAIPEELEKYKPGQSLICKITSMTTIVSNYIHGVQATLNLESKEIPDVMLSCKLLKDYLRKIHNNKKIDKTQGKRMNATVEHVSKDRAFLRLENEHSLQEGMQVQVLVLHTNSLLNECDVTLRQDIINAVNNKKEQDFEVETFYHGTVALATDNFVLVKVKGHLVYIPSRNSGYGYLFSEPSELEGRRMKICMTKNRQWISEFNEREENPEVPETSSVSKQSKQNEKKKSKRKADEAFHTMSETSSVLEQPESYAAKKKKSKKTTDQASHTELETVLEQSENRTSRKKKSKKTTDETSCKEPETVEQPKKSKRKVDEAYEQPIKIAKTQEQTKEEVQKNMKDLNQQKSSLGVQESSKQAKKQILKPLSDVMPPMRNENLKKEEVYCHDQFTWTCSAATEATNKDTLIQESKKNMTSAEKMKLSKEDLNNGYKETDPGNTEPTTPKDYDRLLFSKKNSSKLWIQYITHHLKASEVDKARSVADRALEAIDMREDDERLNIWRTLINIEGRYGDEDSMEKVMQRAAQYCDDFRVFIHALDTLKMTNRWQEAELVVEKLLKKFTSNPETWMHIGDFYYHSGQHSKAEELLAKALTTLLEEQYVTVALHCASLADKYGSRNSQGAASILEMLKTKYPKRLDILFQYVDMLIRQDNCRCAITQLENAAELKLSKKGKEAVAKKIEDIKQKYIGEGDAQGIPRIFALVGMERSFKFRPTSYEA